METIHKQVSVARRRLALELFLRKLPICLCATLLVALAGLAVPKFRPLEINSLAWTVSWLAGAVGLAFLTALVWTWRTCQSPLAAAIEIDRRFGLKERISSVLALSPAELETEVGQALARDAMRRASGLVVREQFAVGPDRRLWLPLLPALAAFGLVAFVPDAQSKQAAQAMPPTPATAQVKKSAEVLRKKLVERRKEAQEKGLENAEGLFRKLEEGTKQLSDASKPEQKEALIKLNDLARELEKRREALGGAEELKKQLGGLKDVNKGPADKLAEAMKEGDLKQAIEAVKNLEQMMRDAKLNDEDKKKLAEQLDQMKDKLADAAKQHEKAVEELKKALDQANAGGDKQRAEQMQKQLDKLQQQAPQMDKLGQMAQKMAEASKNLKQGNAEQAQKQLEEMAQQLQDAQLAEAEMEMIDDAMAQIEEARDAMGCKECGGEGCKACQGGDGNGGQGEGQDGKKKGGQGLGKGQGEGDRPEQETKTGTYDSRVKQDVRKGKAVITDYVQGPNIKGQVLEKVKVELQAERKESADPLSGTRLPKGHQDHAREYFDHFREGE